MFVGGGYGGGVNVRDTSEMRGWGRERGEADPAIGSATILPKKERDLCSKLYFNVISFRIRTFYRLWSNTARKSRNHWSNVKHWVMLLVLQQCSRYDYDWTISLR